MKPLLRFRSSRFEFYQVFSHHAQRRALTRVLEPCLEGIIGSRQSVRVEPMRQHKHIGHVCAALQSLKYGVVLVGEKKCFCDIFQFEQQFGISEYFS